MSSALAFCKTCFVVANFTMLVAVSTAVFAVPTPSIPSVVVNIPASSATPSSKSSLVVTVDGLDAATAANERLLTEPKDLEIAVPSPPTVTFHDPVALPGIATQRRWLLPFTVDSMPAGVELTRYVSMKIGDANWTLGYQLKSPAAVTTSWALKPLPAPSRAIHPKGAVPLNIAITGSMPVSGLRLAQLEFIELGSKRPLAASQLALCENPSPCTGDPITLHTPGAPVWLAPRLLKADGVPPTLWPGKYEGVVLLTSDDKPAGESANLTIYVTSWCWQIAGVVLIGIGIGAAWFFTTFLRQRMAREQMQMMAVVLRAEIDEISHRLRGLNASVPTPNIQAKLGDLDEELSDNTLEQHGLPLSSPLPWPSSIATANVETFKKYLETPAAWVYALQQLVRTGIVPLVKLRNDYVMQNGALSAPQAVEFTKALSALDQMASRNAVPDAATLTADINTQLATFTKAMTPQRAAPHAPPTSGRQDLRSPKQLRLRLAFDGLLAWGFIGTVTALAGAYVLVWLNPGFGTFLDLLGCLLWGLGLPTGTLLASTTTSSIATTLNVTR